MPPAATRLDRASSRSIPGAAYRLDRFAHAPVSPTRDTRRGWGRTRPLGQSAGALAHPPAGPVERGPGVERGAIERLAGARAGMVHRRARPGHGLPAFHRRRGRAGKPRRRDGSWRACLRIGPPSPPVQARPGRIIPRRERGR